MERGRNLIGSHSPPPGAIDNCSGGTLNFGRYWDSNFFNGKIDDIGIWNRALNQQEINSLFGLQPPIQMSALCLPTLITTTPISVGIDSAIVGGNIIYDGGSSIILKGVCYSTSPRPHMGSLRTEDGAGNGPYSSILRGLVSSTAYYARSYAKNSNGVVVYGNEVNFTTSLASPGVRCPGVPTVSDIDGNVYNTVLIGNQCWTQSNLKVSRYRNGDTIPTGLSDAQWGSTTSGSYSIKITQNGCASAMSTPYYFIVTNVINLSSSEFIKLAPNPVKNQLNIDFFVKGYQRLNVDFYELSTGLLKYSNKGIFAGSQLFIGQLSPGTYVVNVRSDDGKIAHKLKVVKL